jgi:hypothetical protein
LQIAGPRRHPTLLPPFRCFAVLAFWHFGPSPCPSPLERTTKPKMVLMGFKMPIQRNGGTKPGLNTNKIFFLSLAKGSLKIFFRSSWLFKQQNPTRWPGLLFYSFVLQTF